MIYEFNVSKHYSAHFVTEYLDILHWADFWFRYNFFCGFN